MKKWLILIIMLAIVLPAMADNILLDSADVDWTFIYSYDAEFNYGADTEVRVGQAWTTRLEKALLRFPDQNDTMQNHSGVVWDSALASVCLHVSDNRIDAGDSICITAFLLLQSAWVEGPGEGGDTCGVSWDSANATGWGGCSGTPTDWNTDGALGAGTDYVNTRLQLRLDGGEYADSLWLYNGLLGDTIYVLIPASDVDDTLNNAGITFYYCQLKDNNADNDCHVAFAYDEGAGTGLKPTLNLFHTAGGATWSCSQSVAFADTADTTVSVAIDYTLANGAAVDTAHIQYSYDNFSSVAGDTAIPAPADPDTVKLFVNEHDSVWVRTIALDVDSSLSDTSATIVVQTFYTVAQSLSSSGVSSNTFNIINTYTANTVDSMQLLRSTSNDTSGAVIGSSKTTGFGSPDTLDADSADSLAASTKYYVWVLLFDHQMGATLSAVDSVTTTSGTCDCETEIAAAIAAIEDSLTAAGEAFRDSIVSAVSGITAGGPSSWTTADTAAFHAYLSLWVSSDTAAATKVWSSATRTLTQSVGIPDSSAGDISYIANNPNDYKATGFSTHSAADVWAVGSRSLTDKAGFSLASTGLNGVTQATGSVIFSNTSIGTVATVTNGVTVTTNNDKTGYGLTTAERAAIEDTIHANANDYKADVSGLSTFNPATTPVTPTDTTATRGNIMAQSDTTACHGSGSLTAEAIASAVGDTTGRGIVGAGSGDYACTLLVLNTTDSTTIADVGIKIFAPDGGTLLAWPETNVSGIGISLLDATDSLIFYPVKIGVSFTVPEYITVTGNQTDTIWGVVLSPSPATGDMVALQFYQLTPGYDTLSATQVKYRLVKDSTGTEYKLSDRLTFGTGTSTITLTKSWQTVDPQAGDTSYVTFSTFSNYDIYVNGVQDSSSYFEFVTMWEDGEETRTIKKIDKTSPQNPNAP